MQNNANTNICLWAVIPTWNRKKDLIECLQSLEASNYTNLRIVVVDNASTDGSKEAVKNLFPKVSLIELPENTGAAYASNRGFEMAINKGANLILRLDSDLIIDPDLIPELVEKYLELPEAGILFPKILRYDDPDRIWYTGAKSHPFLLVSRIDNLNVKDDLSHDVTQIDYAPSAAILISSQVIEKTGGFDETYFVYSEDFDLCLRVRRLGYKIFYIPTARAWHKIGSEKLSDWGLEQFYRGRMLFYRKNTSGLHRFFLTLYAFFYVFYRSIFRSPHDHLWPSIKGLISALSTTLRR